ncbi:MAG: pyridoxal-phosphate dependent enzyme [Patescibacteria group bacterium]
MNSPELQTAVNLELLDEIHLASQVMSEPDSPVLGTELYRDDLLSDRYDADIWLASELHQVIKAYKIRGAYNFLGSLSDDQRSRGVVTASAGNHGQGIALSSDRTGVASHVFMPQNTPYNKVGLVASLGGENTQVTLVGDTFDETQEHALKFSEATGAVYAPPFNDLKVIAGQGTWGLEIAQELPNIDLVMCPVGGMGLLAGTSTAVKSEQPDARVVGVEPAAASSLGLAYANGSPSSLASIDTFVDGAAVKRVGEIPFRLASHLVDDLVTVTNQEVRQATTDLWERPEPVRAELAGALSVAGLHKHAEFVRGKTVVCMVSGGNLSPERYKAEVRV